MLKLEDAVVKFLETYGQPQQYSVIADHLANEGYANYSKDDLDGMVEDRLIQTFADGVQANGEPMMHYAPLAFGAS